MRKGLFVILFCLMAITANAENWVCQDGSNLKRLQGDGFSLGIATINYNTIDANCIMATVQEYSDASLPDKKLDKAVITGNRIVDMTQAEIDARDLAIANAQAAELSLRLQDLDNIIDSTDPSIILTKADNAIDNITNLSQAKVFLKKLVRAIVTLHASE